MLTDVIISTFKSFGPVINEHRQHASPIAKNRVRVELIGN